MSMATARAGEYRGLLERGALDVVEIAEAESNLRVAGSRVSAEAARAALVRARRGVESCIRDLPAFLSSLAPVDVPERAPPIARRMAHAARRAGVGPMAAVAGAIAETVARELNENSPEVIVENGGDLFCIVTRPRLVALALGTARFESAMALRLDPAPGPCGVASSSGTAGGSLSFGRADLVTVVARTGALADAVATAAGNRVQGAGSVGTAVDFAMAVAGVIGAIAIADGAVALRGRLDVVAVN